MPETADRTESLFAAAVALAPEERGAYLERECSGDPALRDRVLALLRAHDRAGHVIDRPVNGDPDQTAGYAPTSEQPGTIIAGRYKLLEEIGQGGMGTVWAAEQTTPVRRKVALKLIKAGMDSRSVLARFEAERQALALMDHPNIAKVLDGGLTDSGRPYFVMEYVKGVPITEYCDATRLSVEERLNLFIQVCSALQHAHQKGIIHRDLKPSNILVAPYDDKPVPKVIDFGLAKAMHQSLTEKTLYTAHETVLGTPLYMSPEQAQLNNLDVDTRADIYSLGVLLYELLTGTTPLERQAVQGGRLGRDSADDPRGGTAAAEHAVELDRYVAFARDIPSYRAGEAQEAGARRARLDRHEGVGEGPHQAVRDGERPRPRHPALPGRRGCRSASSQHRLPNRQVRSSAQGPGDCRGPGDARLAGRDRRHDLGVDQGGACQDATRRIARPRKESERRSVGGQRQGRGPL